MNIHHAFLLLLIIKTSFVKSKHKKEYRLRTEDIDTIIDKILSSDRFNELADKIADRAIKKISDEKSDHDPGNHTLSTPGTRSNNENLNIKVSKKDRKHLKFDKIDVDTVLQKKRLPVKNLTFRYERFVKNAKMDNAKPQLEKHSHEKSISNTTMKEFVESAESGIFQKRNMSKDSDEISKSDIDENIKSEEKISTKQFSSESTKSNDDLMNKEQTTESKRIEYQFGNAVPIVWSEKDNDDSDTDVKQWKDRDEENVNNRSKKQLKEFIASRQKYNRADKNLLSVSSDDNDLNYGVNKQSNMKDLKEDHEDSTKKHVQMIRREGDKLFALEESPDYREYHEMLAKATKIINI